jgi:2-aminoadipate transaminase
MVIQPKLDESADSALYRQLAEYFKSAIISGALAHGERLPATRELAGQLGLNRTTVSAAYDLLETEGLISGHVGRGSFVTFATPSVGVNWADLLSDDTRPPAPVVAVPENAISFAVARPSEALFPLDDFRRTCEEVIAAPDAASILQLGSAGGYGPLRRYLLEDARRQGIAGPQDDIAITSGIQQALDLIQRTLISEGDVVAVEDPVYPGLRNALTMAGARLAAIPVGSEGIDLDALARAVRQERPRMLVVTPNFQNPTGATLPAASRAAIVRIAHEHGIILVENDVYGALRYTGEPIAPLKRLDDGGDTILLRSFSKIAFPGLRVGWVIGPRAFIRRLSEAKQWCDLHTDQLSQAVLLRFAESGRLEEHRGKMLASGRERLHATLEACARHLPPGCRFTHPEGGMNIWVTLPESLDAGELLPRVQREKVTYLPGRYFEVSRSHANALRLSFAGLEPERIEQGIAILGRVFSSELERVRGIVISEAALV